MAKLVERLDELRAKEAGILSLIHGEQIVQVELNIFDSESEDDEKNAVKMIDDQVQVTSETSSIKDAFEAANHHAITDDYSNYDFASRVDEWLSVKRFGSTWGQHRSFFVGPTLAQQVSYQLSAMDTVSICNEAFQVPKCLWDELFDYQKEGVEWMLRLHRDDHGGVLGDEMGLGKTIQVVTYLAALHVSGHLAKSGLIIVPSTLLRQWIRELNTWWPPLRVILLHTSSPSFAATRSSKQFIASNASKAHVFITSYGTASSELQRTLLQHQWSFVVLDEGHKIRNPDAQVTLFCKQLQSYHRYALSGTPIQNNLTELWSLFDFVYPGLLGVS